MKRIRIGVYGDNGHQVTRWLGENPNINAVIAASCQCGSRPGTEGAAVYASLGDMLRDDTIRLVSLCSPMRSAQAEDAIRCLEAGKHVYAEKPCAFTEKDLDRILATAKKMRREFHEMSETAFEQPYYAMMRLVKSGAVGEVVQAVTQKSYPPLPGARPRDEAVDGGLLMQAGIHNMRLTEQITGLKIGEVVAFETQSGGLTVAASFAMRLGNGAVASGAANYLNPKEVTGKHGYECVRVFGTAGFVETLDGGRRARLVANGDVAEVDTTERVKTYFERYIDYLSGLDEMPLTEEEEFHPLRTVIRAKTSAGR